MKTQKAETGEGTGKIVSHVCILYLSTSMESRDTCLALENFIILLLSYGFFMSAVYMLKRNP